MARGKKAVTIKDVALAAGVSASTVSKVLNDAKAFPEETTRKVLKAARNAGYIPNPYARSIVTGRTGVIGVRILDIANPYFANIVKGAQGRASEAGFNLLVADSREDPEVEIGALQELARRSDGVILAGSRLSADRLVGLAGIPTVIIGRSVPDGGFVCIHHPLEQRLALAIEHLVELGHRDIALILPRHLAHRVDLLERHAERGRSLRIVQAATPDIDGGEAAARLVLGGGAPAPTAVVGYNDLVCYGVMRWARQRGIAIPRDLSLVGSDDLAFNEIVEPPLTSIRGDQLGVGALAVEILAEWVSAGSYPAQTIELESRLVVRSSTAAPRGGRAGAPGG